MKTSFLDFYEMVRSIIEYKDGTTVLKGLVSDYVNVIQNINVEKPWSKENFLQCAIDYAKKIEDVPNDDRMGILDIIMASTDNFACAYALAMRDNEDSNSWMKKLNVIDNVYYHVFSFLRIKLFDLASPHLDPIDFGFRLW